MPKLPPRWFVRSAWIAHRALLRVTFDRVGLSLPTSDRCGMLRLHTLGRRSGRPRAVVLCYIQDGDNLSSEQERRLYEHYGQSYPDQQTSDKTSDEKRKPGLLQRLLGRDSR